LRGTTGGFKPWIEALIRFTTGPVLLRFRGVLSEIHGERLDRVVLFGSRAGGGARSDADYDVAVFLKDFHDRCAEVDRIIPIVTDILYDPVLLSMRCPTAPVPIANAHHSCMKSAARSVMAEAERSLAKARLTLELATSQARVGPTCRYRSKP
jgi:hypothetical protein